MTLSLSQEKDKKDEDEVVELPIQDEIPLANIDPKSKTKMTSEGTPKKDKQMAFVLKAILKSIETEEPSNPKLAPPSPKKDSVAVARVLQPR